MTHLRQTPGQQQNEGLQRHDPASTQDTSSEEIHFHAQQQGLDEATGHRVENMQEPHKQITPTPPTGGRAPVQNHPP